MLKTYSAVAPGSPLIFAPLVVVRELAIYDDGKDILSPPVPKENVSFLELDTPLIVITFSPTASADAASSIFTYSGLPAWDTFLTTLVTLAAFQVSVVVLTFLPVCCAVEDTVTLVSPLPLAGVTFTQFAFAI